MEQENKYYTPDVENIRYGYEMEWLNKANESSFVLDGVDVDTWTKWDYEFQGLSLNGIRNMIADKRLRVPYLTKEQIEELGWKHIGTMRDGGTTTYQIKDKYTLDYRETNQILKGTERYREITIKELTENHMFKHLITVECKSINDLRYLMKLLKIQ